MHPGDNWLSQNLHTLKFIFCLPESAAIAYTVKTSLQMTKFGKV